jgi:cytochrome P450
MASAARRLSPEVVDSFPCTRERALGGAEESVRWSDTLRAWVVVRHADVMACLRETRLGCSRVDFHEASSQGPGPELLQAFRKVGGARLEAGGERVALRWLAAPAFTPEALESWRPALVRRVRQLLEGVEAQGRMDAVRSLTEPLAALVLAEVFAIPEGHRDDFLGWVRAMFEGPGPLQALLATREFLDYLAPLLAERRLNPGTDLLSRVLRAQPPGTVNPEPRVAGLALLLVSGLASFADQLGNGLRELLAHGGVTEALRAEPSRVVTAVEEVLRLNPAVPVLHRSVLETFTLGGQSLREGDDVLLSLQAANRDPDVFPLASHLLLSRDCARQKHLTLGFGLHQRLDAGLLKHTLKALIEGVLEVLPGLRLDETLPAPLKAREPHLRGHESLPVRWEST